MGSYSGFKVYVQRLLNEAILEDLERAPTSHNDCSDTAKKQKKKRIHDSASGGGAPPAPEGEEVGPQCPGPGCPGPAGRGEEARKATRAVRAVCWLVVPFSVL